MPSFDADASLEFTRALATRFPGREASSAVFDEAKGYVASQLGSADFLPFPVRAGKVNLVPVKAGTSNDVIWTPPGYRPSKPHLVVGAHLDTVLGTPGANDDGSGIGMLIELQHLVRAAPSKLPCVFVAFGAEERRRQSPSESQYAIGSHAYLASLSKSERSAISGALILDMVSVGHRVHLLGKGGPLLSLALTRARALGIDAFFDISQFFSDHIAFQDYKIPVVWMYSGDDAAFHTPHDNFAHLQRAEVQRIGRLAWDLIRHARA